jgi:hypothetical protein
MERVTLRLPGKPTPFFPALGITPRISSRLIAKISPAVRFFIERVTTGYL